MSALLTAAERVMIKTSPIDRHPIPPMTDPMGKHWEQPARERIEIDADSALMTLDDFEQLLDYSHSQPSGVYPGKMWKTQRYIMDPARVASWPTLPTREWWLHWFGTEFEKDGLKFVTNHARRILVV